MKRKIVVSLILVAVLLVTGIGVAGYLVKTRPTIQRLDIARAPVLVQWREVRPQTIPEPIVGYGTARADRHARLSAQVAGQIVELAGDLKAGMAVTGGQLLVRISDEEFRQRLARAGSAREAAEAQLAQLEVEQVNLDRLIAISQEELRAAEWEFGKVKALNEQGNAPKREFEQARLVYERTRREHQSLENQKDLIPTRRSQLKAEVENRRAEVELARIDLDRCMVRAPFGGCVGAMNVEVGERVQPGMQLVTVLDPGLIEVPVQLPLSTRRRVQVGAAVELSLESDERTIWAGVVNRIAPEADAANRIFELFVEVDNARPSGAGLMPGCFVRAAIQGEVLSNVMVVPRGAIRAGEVFVHVDGKARSQKVHVQRLLLDGAIVTGLSEGDVVITSNLNALHDGAAVQLGDATVDPGGRTVADLHHPPNKTALKSP